MSDEYDGRLEEVPDDAIVIRFKPITVAGLQRSADQHYRDLGAYRLSIFADTARAGEGERDVIRRLIEASVKQNLRPESNKKLFVCMKARDLKYHNFTFWTDFATDVPEHYSIDIGEHNSEERVRDFIGCFEAEPRDRT